MTDVFSTEKRSSVMRSVRSNNTSPEIRVRRFLHRSGFRFRLHREDLPGKPDIVFPARRTVLFVHGCFWHGHTCKRGARVPATNTAYWLEKVSRNKLRDASHVETLRKMGWTVLTIWECETADTVRLGRLIERLRSQSGQADA